MGLWGTITLRIIVVVRWRNGRQREGKEQTGARRNGLRDGYTEVKTLTDSVPEADLTPDDPRVCLRAMVLINANYDK